jgi:hypothetical protein
MSKRTLIEDIRYFAKQKGGELLSDNYINNKQKLLWKCDCGNEWKTSWVDIRYRNSWCPNCSSIIRTNKLRKYNIDELNEFVINKNGILLSKKYVNCDSKIKIICNNNHVFYLTTRQLESNCWCPECDINSLINQFMLKLKNNNGKLVSGKIINNQSKVMIECENNHIWKTKIYNIIYNETWCPFCLKNVGEEKIVEYLENNNIKFNRQHTFNDLTGKTKRKTKLRFDFYLPEHNILIEFDGKQHYEPVNFGGCSDEQAFNIHEKLISNDNIKNKYCFEKDIQLIRIPYTIKNIKNELNKQLF